MNKLLSQYRAKPSFANARKVRAYERAHSMSIVMLSKEDRDLLADAIYHANQGITRMEQDQINLTRALAIDWSK